MASPDLKISKAFYQYISKLKDNHEFEDFIVKIDNENFSCHSFILASCSEFFRCLLRSEMKEKKEMTVGLKNIPSPIFLLILKTLYTGCELLTKENVLEIWSAVHQLQIHFLMEHCEDFVIDNLTLDTLESYKEHADYLQSKKVNEYIFNFILKNFEKINEKEVFFQLDIECLERLLKSDNLEADSEDIVLNSIFKWANYKPSFAQAAGYKSKDGIINTLQDIDVIETKEVTKKDNSSLEEYSTVAKEEEKLYFKNLDKEHDRKVYLAQLLKSTRYYLASEKCILKLFKHHLTQDDILVKEILSDALFFNVSDSWRGHWPTTAIHRESSGFEHVGIYSYDGILSVLSLKENKWFRFKNLNKQQHSHLTVFKGKLYACSMGRTFNEMYVLNGNSWEQVLSLKQAFHMLFTHEKCIYILDSSEKAFIKFNPDTFPRQIEVTKHELQNSEFALSYHGNILVFCSVENNGLEETVVHCWNTENNEWTQLDNLKFSPKNITSFCDDSNTYILDSNGCLWKLINTEMIAFTCVAQLWSVKYNVRGAAVFRKKLYIFGDSPKTLVVENRARDLFTDINVWGTDVKTSNFIYYVIPKSEIEHTNPA